MCGFIFIALLSKDNFNLAGKSPLVISFVHDRWSVSVTSLSGEVVLSSSL